MYSVRLAAPGCPLTKPALIVASRESARYVQSRADSFATWNTSLAESPSPYYRFKAGLAQETRCDDEPGYGATRTVAAKPTIDEALPAREGLYLLCIEGSSDGHSFDEPDAALSLLSEVDNTPPQLPDASQLVSVYPDGQLSVRLAVDSLEIAKFYYRLQRPAETDCTPDASDLVATTWQEFSISPSEPRRELCLTAEDAAGNRSRASRVSLELP